jgi:cellobionic acid phosphorylase
LLQAESPRSLVEGPFGMKGDRQGLVIAPQLPSHWSEAKVTRTFRGAVFNVEIRRKTGLSRTVVVVDGRELPGNRMTDFRAGRSYKVEVNTPA